MIDDCCLMLIEHYFQLYHGENNAHCDDRLVLDQCALLDFYGSISLNQQSVGNHLAPIGQIILIPNQPISVRKHYC